jgi:hypothetical protein
MKEENHFPMGPLKGNDALVLSSVVNKLGGIEYLIQFQKKILSFSLFICLFVISNS